MTSTVSRCRATALTIELPPSSWAAAVGVSPDFPTLTPVSPPSEGTLWGQPWGQPQTAIYAGRTASETAQVDPPAGSEPPRRSHVRLGARSAPAAYPHPRQSHPSAADLSPAQPQGQDLSQNYPTGQLDARRKNEIRTTVSRWLRSCPPRAAGRAGTSNCHHDCGPTAPGP